MAGQTTINLAGNDPRVVCSAPVDISNESDIDKTRGILLGPAGKHPKAGGIVGRPPTRPASAGFVLTLAVSRGDAICPGGP